jgi:hypothetical protein
MEFLGHNIYPPMVAHPIAPRTTPRPSPVSSVLPTSTPWSNLGHIKRLPLPSALPRPSEPAAVLSRGSEAMSLGSKPPVLASLIGGAFAMMVLTSPSPAFSEGTLGASGPFDALAGLWSGNGVVETSDGLHERVRCKATYVAEDAGHIVKLQLRCASDAYKFELSSNIMQTGDSLSGNWFESTHRVGGSISGRNTGHEIDARAEGDTFTALLTVKTSGRHQSFLMESPGAKVSQVSINLSQTTK